MAAGLPAALAVIEQHLHQPLPSQPGERIALLLHFAVEVVAQLIETFDPSQGQRFDGRCRLAMDRALASAAMAGDRPLGSGAEAGRAAARHQPGAVPVAGLFDAVAPWQPLLELRADWRVQIPHLPDEEARLIVRLYGLDGRPPMTPAELAEACGLSATVIARTLRRAEAMLRERARER